jgi:hypothetical protein
MPSTASPSSGWKKLRGVLTVLGVLSIIPLIVYLWDEGYLGSHWKRYDSTNDPKVKAFRCLDEKGDVMDDSEPPCFVLTVRGRKAMARHQKACEEKGGTQEACYEEAWTWLMSKKWSVERMQVVAIAVPTSNARDDSLSPSHLQRSDISLKPPLP